MHPIFQTDEIFRLVVSHVAYPIAYSPHWSHSPSQQASSNFGNLQTNRVVHLASNTASYRGNGDYIDGAVGSCVPPLGSSERKALAKLARTCRAWEGVALDALWREIPTVEPLFGLFPPSCIGGATRHESLFTRPLVPSDWARFSHYAHRVHRIALPDSRWPRFTVDVKTFLSLSHFHPHSPILPNLQHWSWDTHRGSDIVGGMCFLSPSVTSISVTLGHTTSHDTLFGFLYNLPMRCPRLEQLELCYNDREWPDWGLEATMTTLQRVFEELTDLRRLCLPYFMDTPVFVRKVGAIPGLKELVISCPEKLVGAFVDDDSDEGNLGMGVNQLGGPKNDSEQLFADLETVTLQSTMSSCFRFLRRFSSRDIQCMYLTILHLRSATQLDECVNLIATSSPHLKIFHLQYTPATHDLSFDTSYFRLDTLKTCAELEEVSIGHPRVAPWNDDDVLEAIRCWPRLRILRLNPRPGRAVVESRLTLKTLWNLVRWCSRLEVVRFYVDTSVIPDLGRLVTLDSNSSSFPLDDPLALPGLESLGVAGIKGSSVLSLVDFGISQRSEASTQELATFIATLCPVAQVQSSETWKEVGVILKVNQATREEDRRRIETLRSEVVRLSRLLAAGRP